MAVAIINTGFPEQVGPDAYDRVNAEMGVEDDMPKGLIFHWAGYIDGKWTITDVWESREDYDSFAAERLTPAIAKVAGELGLEVVPPTTKEEDVHNFIKA
jgi:hypothetical protein